MISKFADAPLFAPYAADAHRINMEIRTICFLNLSPPFIIRSLKMSWK